MNLEPEVRRSPRPDTEPPGDEPDLVVEISREIEQTGPITFARFMELALYHPTLGYYRSARPGPGRGGDFLTAPETHPIFGQVLARHLEELWARLGKPDPFVVREYGAGGGALAEAVLGELARPGGPLARTVLYDPREVNPHRRRELLARLTAAGLGHLVLAGPTPSVRPGTPVAGVVIANEFLDALPVHRVIRRGARLQEILVGREGNRFVDVPTEPTTPELAARLRAEAIDLADGQVAEVCLATDDWLAEVAAGLQRGYALVIDYGHPAAELYAPVRGAGTLLGYAAHRVVDEPYANVGRQDLTAHVDFTAVNAAAVRRGWFRWP